MANKTRVAVVGAGSRSRQAALPALAAIDDVEIVGLCDINAELCDKTADRFGIAARFSNGFADYQRMVKELSPDAVVSIGNQHELYDSWRWLLEQGVPLAIEKPLGLTFHHTRALVHLAEQAGVATQVLFQRRYTPVAVKAYDMCKERGDIVHAVCRFYKCDMKPMLGARDHLLDDTVHSVDTIRWLCGGEVVNVESHCRRVGTPDVNFISATLYFDNGSTGHIINSWTSGKRIFSVEMHAKGIFADIEHEKGGLVFSDGSLDGLQLDAVDLLEELPANVVRRVLRNTDEQTRRIINEFLKYPEQSAGSIMTIEYVDLREQFTV
ncbi:MAG: Gfo/Idh/MocA family oxidoreductase, partial [Oscillospiraceae bacterium]|nr:Gfo/Idh/MocA family oxidoreductase [Oscillospiraceae bacterium]